MTKLNTGRGVCNQSYTNATILYCTSSIKCKLIPATHSNNRLHCEVQQCTIIIIQYILCVLLFCSYNYIYFYRVTKILCYNTTYSTNNIICSLYINVHYVKITFHNYKKLLHLYTGYHICLSILFT